METAATLGTGTFLDARALSESHGLDKKQRNTEQNEVIVDLGIGEWEGEGRVRVYPGLCVGRTQCWHDSK